MFFLVDSELSIVGQPNISKYDRAHVNTGKYFSIIVMAFSKDHASLYMQENVE